jgi:hypothetical protein
VEVYLGARARRFAASLLAIFVLNACSGGSEDPPPPPKNNPNVVDFDELQSRGVDLNGRPNPDAEQEADANAAHEPDDGMVDN